MPPVADVDFFEWEYFFQKPLQYLNHLQHISSMYNMYCPVNHSRIELFYTQGRKELSYIYYQIQILNTYLYSVHNQQLQDDFFVSWQIFQTKGVLDIIFHRMFPVLLIVSENMQDLWKNHHCN